MTTHSALATAAVLLVACSAASAESQVNASLAGVADDNDSHSVEADVAFTPVDWLQLAIGGGSTTSPSTVGSMDGKSLRGSVDLRSERFGLRGYYRQWTSPMFDTDTTGARASIGAGAFTISIAGEKRGFDADYVSGGSNPQRSTQHFAGTGWGGGLKYSRSGWTGYADAMFYHYGSLSRYVETYSTSVVPVPGPAPTVPTGPTVPSIPLPSLLDTVAALPVVSSALVPVPPMLPESVLTVAPVLTTSIVTIEEGALDRLFTAGIERTFTRVSLRLDWTGAKDTILSGTTNSYRAGIGYAISNHVNVDIMAGVTDSYVGSASFGGVSIGFVF